MKLSLRGAHGREVHLALFTVYLDDSGTSPSQHVAIASAFIVPAARLELLENEWHGFKEKEGFSCFHMSEFVALNPKSEFANWQDKQERISQRLKAIIKKYGVKGLSIAINKGDYDQIVPDEMRQYAGKYHYTWAIRNIFALIDKWAHESNVTTPLEYIFDSMGKRNDPRRQEVEEVMEQAEDLATQAGKPGTYTHYSFRDRCELPALQCADILAWLCYQRSLVTFRQLPIKQIATDMFNDFVRYKNRNWLWAMFMERAKLAEWVQKEQADGRSMKRFQAWDEKKKAAAEGR